MCGPYRTPGKTTFKTIKRLNCGAEFPKKYFLSTCSQTTPGNLDVSTVHRRYAHVDHRVPGPSFIGPFFLPHSSMRCRGLEPLMSSPNPSKWARRKSSSHNSSSAAFLAHDVGYVVSLSLFSAETLAGRKSNPGLANADRAGVTVYLRPMTRIVQHPKTRPFLACSSLCADLLFNVDFIIKGPFG